MLFQQNILIIGVVDFYSRINEDQVCTTKRRNRNGHHNKLAEIDTRTQQSVQTLIIIFLSIEYNVTVCLNHIVG